jgi:hypothetical protein
VLSTAAPYSCGPAFRPLLRDWLYIFVGGFMTLSLTGLQELHRLYSSPSIIKMIKSRRMRWTGHVARMGEKRNAYRILVGKPEGERPLGRPRRRWVDVLLVFLLGLLLDLEYGNATFFRNFHEIPYYTA